VGFYSERSSNIDPFAETTTTIECMIAVLFLPPCDMKNIDYLSQLVCTKTLEYHGRYGGTVALGQWTHLALTYDGTGTDGDQASLLPAYAIA